MKRTSLRTDVGRKAQIMRRRVGSEIRRLRLDANLSRRALAASAGIDHGYLSQIETGSREASYAVLLAVGDALGADVHLRLYPTTGPRIHDRIQAAMVEAFLGIIHRRWKPHLEVAVVRPARGFIDVVLASDSDQVIVAMEAQSEIRRLEQHLRWAQDKAGSLPSSAAWPLLSSGERPPRVSRLLLLRSTRTTRDLARTYESTFAASYPARSIDVFRALTTSAPWPGAGILWVAIDGGTVRVLDRPPRGVSLGR